VNRVLAAATAALLVGCGEAHGDDERAARALGEPPIHPVPGCETIDHRSCDIEVAACRERLIELAACLRGSDAIPVPPVTTMTTAEYAAIVNARLAENPPPDPNHYEQALVMLGLAEPGELSSTMIDADDVTLLGVYRFEEKDILIIDHDNQDGNEEERSNSTLVHEFVHALQDRDIDLAATYDEVVTSYDSYLAYGSVVEGEARLHETRFTASLLGLDPASIDWDERFQNLADLRESTVLDESSPYSATWGFFPYVLGSRFVHHAWSRSGYEGVRELYDSPPTRAHAIMASASDIVVDDWPEPVFEAPEAPTPWMLWSEESLGAWGVLLVLTRSGTPEGMRPLALDWRGDRLWTYSNDAVPAQTTMVWEIEFANVESATRVESVAPSTMGVVRRDRRVVLASSTGTTAIDWALVP
jgi:hypothetical protein